jgi:hypothetical protein
MVAAMQLARQGYEVEVVEAAAVLGGIGGFHPSLHVTPMDRQWVSQFIGCDITQAVAPSQEFRFWIQNDAYAMHYPVLCYVERGNRLTSLDQVLFRECAALGVKFHFGVRLKKATELPPGSIFACGLHPAMYEELGIPFQRIYGSYIALELESGGMDRHLSCYFDDYTRDYYYSAGVNQLWYGLLFGREPLTEEGRAACLKHIESREGVRATEWRHITGCTPTGSISNPRLFAGKYLLAGTMSGMMDPFFLFGIHGALLSGKVAAMAVDQPEEALRLFRSLNRHFWKAYLLRKGYEVNPFGFSLYRNMMAKQRLFLPLPYLLGLGVPGGPKGWFREAARSAVQLPPADRV